MSQSTLLSSRVFGLRPSTLLFVLDGAEQFRVPIPRRRTVVGRSRACGIHLPQGDGVLSRRHLVLDRDDGRVTVADLSTNGTEVNGDALGTDPRPLSIGDRVRAAGWEIVVEPGFDRGLGDGDPTTVRFHRGRAEATVFCDMVGDAPPMRELYRIIERLGPFPLPVLVHGETGTGKERVAAALHATSPRAAGPFVAINCGALHPDTAHSTLFGHERGAFTGAEARRLGAFRRAHEGTLFLDEIAELSPALQAALLHVLENGEVQPLGSHKSESVEVRLVAATHKDLRREVVEGRFREDLYYRICVASLRVPPLRERPGDLEALATHFLAEHAVDRVPMLTDGALGRLRAHPWPGNVRELRNCMLRALVASAGGTIQAHHIDLQPGLGITVPPSRGRTWLVGAHPAPLRASEPAPDDPELLLNTLRRHGGNRAEAARALGISRSTLYERMKRAGIETRKRHGAEAH